MKNNKGFFLAETIVVLSLVTTIIAFVSANVPTIYKNYKLQSESYDQTEDLYLLRAIYDTNKRTIDDYTYSACSDGLNPDIGQKYVTSETLEGNNKINVSLLPSTGYDNIELYLTGYLTQVSSSTYDFNKYLKRLKRTSNYDSDYRLIGVITRGGKTYYASIRIDNPNPNRVCNR